MSRSDLCTSGHACNTRSSDNWKSKEGADFSAALAKLMDTVHRITLHVEFDTETLPALIGLHGWDFTRCNLISGFIFLSESSESGIDPSTIPGKLWPCELYVDSLFDGVTD